MTTQQTAEAFAPAKVNLTLRITGRRDDGYHLLDSLVVFADVGDRLRVAPAPCWSLRVEGPRTAGVPSRDSNIVMRAAHAMGGPPCAITLEKHLPLAAGIGGGSSDAAAVMRALHRLDGRAFPADVTALGADVLVCMAGLPSRMEGIGEVVTPLEGMPALDMVLVNPGAEVSTPDVFRELGRDRDIGGCPAEPKGLDASDLIPRLAGEPNDLEPPAIRLAPAIADTLAALRATAPRLARMSGSGATCFGLYDSTVAAASAAAAIARDRPEWWVRACRTGASGAALA